MSEPEPQPPKKVRPSTKTAWDIINNKDKWSKATIEALTPSERKLLAGLVTKVCKNKVDVQTGLLPLLLPYLSQ
jgi:hypothetical protein